METTQIVSDFFDGYARALLARDAVAVADHYAVPALILFPGQSIPVGDRDQTEQFFTAAFGQYEGVTDTETRIQVPAATGHSIWADVTWQHRGVDGDGPRERMLYQLVDGPDGWRIAVLTPYAPDGS